MKYLLIVPLIFLTGCTASSQTREKVPPTVKDIDKLILQLEGKACYWNQWNEKVKPFENIKTRHFSKFCQQAAASRLGQLGLHAKPAVPALIKALERQTVKGDSENTG